jgi:hypothetical protein
MGEPENKSNFNYSYGISSITFYNDKVTGWSTIDRKLKVSIGNKKDGGSPFTVGSTKRQVVDAMGTPGSASSNLFTYGLSTVFFDPSGKVTGWSMIDVPRVQSK